MSNITLSTDIYDIAASVEEVKGQYIEEDEETLATDIYGYLGAIETRKIQSSIMVASELSNELFAQRAKYKRNLLSHAINLNITNINAIPARMNFYLMIEYNDLIDNLDVNSSFIVDKNFTFNVAGFDFHPSYDVVIRKSMITGDNGKKEVFSAQYIIEHKDPNANINSPYLPSPMIVMSNKQKMVAVMIQFSQMSYDTQYTSIITNSIIENKMTTFTFTDQLAYFEVIVNNEDYVVPIFEGSAVPDGVETFCYYTYMNDDTIRVKFDRSSYMPKLNDEIKINIYTTKGSSANFKYANGNIIVGNLESNIYGYTNIDYELHPLTDSLYGEDQKTKEELRKIIPKEELMKGIISTTDDLNNYFNMVNTKDIVLRVQKKIDNQTERTFYTYFVMKDSENNVVPTNTLNLYIAKEYLQFQDLQNNSRWILPAGTVFGYHSKKNRLEVYDSDTSVNMITTADYDDMDEIESDDDSYSIIDSNYGNLNDPTNFVYISPFVIMINQSPLYMQYYLTKIDQTPYLEFKFINLNAPLSFIASTAHWERKFYTDRDKYTLSVSLAQNIQDEDLRLIETIPIVDDPDKLAEGEYLDLYEYKMNLLFYKNSEYIDYNKCYGRYWLSPINLTTLNTRITSQIPQEESGYINEITESNVLRFVGDLKNTTTYNVYTAIKTSINTYYPCKVGTLTINVSETQGVYKRTLSARLLQHSPSNFDFMSTIFNQYMVYTRKIDVMVNRNQADGSIDSLFYDTLTEAVSNTVTKDGNYYVYTKDDHGDLLYLGTISTIRASNYATSGAITYQWETYDYNIKDDSTNIFSEYMITHDKFDVWEYVDDKYTYYKTLNKAVGAGLYDGKENYYVYIKTTVNGKYINHPIYLGQIHITGFTTTDNYYIASISFLEECDIYVNRYDEYRNYYYLSDIILPAEISSEMYSKSLFDAILNQRPESGLWKIYTHSTGSLNPVLMGTINLTRCDKDGFACTYEWETQEEYEIIPHMKVFALFYRDGSPYRWLPLIPNMTDSNIEGYEFNFKTQIRSLEFSESGAAFDVDNNLYIDDMYIPKTNRETGKGYFNATTTLELYVFAELKDDNGNVYEYPHIGGLVESYPGLNPVTYFSEDMVKGYTLCNIYTVPNGVKFYEIYGNIMNSVVTPIESELIEGETAGYNLTTVPVVGYRYSKDEAHISEVIDAMSLRKAYIDNILNSLENTIGIDFKFFNTFGPSKTFTLDQADDYIDRVNISLHFRVKLSEYNDDETVIRIKADVKEYIENLNYIDSEHISILITQINTDYSEEIEYFDFIGFNNYSSDELHIYRDPDETVSVRTAPELLNVNNTYNVNTKSFEPDIYVEVIKPF